MNYEDVLAWLTRRMRIRSAGTICGSVLAFFGGIWVLLITYGVVYAVCQLSLGWLLGSHHWSFELIAMASIPAFFWGNSRDPDESALSDRAFSGRNSLKTHASPLASAMTHRVHNVDDMEYKARAIASFLYIGPRAILASFRLFKTWRQIQQMNVPDCARVLCLLFRCGKPLSFQEIVAALGCLNPVEIFPQMHLIGGVRFLEREPPGLMLDSNLRQQMSEALGTS